jgi:hypothetical protein
MLLNKLHQKNLFLKKVTNQKMKKQILLSLISLGSMLTLNAQIYGTIEASSGNANVGIGIQTPNVKLEVLGDYQGNIARFRTTESELTLKDYNSGIISFQMRDLDNLGNLYEPMTLRRDFIGIGTTNPERKLDVEGSVRVKSGNGFEFIRVGNAYGYSLWSNDAGHFCLGQGPASNLRQNIHLFIDANTSFVGIGTTTPTNKLDVAGTIRACEVKVDLGSGQCPDFVFKNDYKLMSLKELEAFVKSNQHLPEISPEKEMVENGVNMKELQMKLLQKIEELTLYTIEQNKKIEALQNEMKEMKAASTKWLTSDTHK